LLLSCYQATLAPGGAERTSDLFNSGQKLGGLQPLSFQGAGY
jgi:hypothetical protein